MYKFALLSILAVIAAADDSKSDDSGSDDSGSTTDPVTTNYSGAGAKTTKETDADGEKTTTDVFTTTLGFDITTATDSVTTGITMVGKLAEKDAVWSTDADAYSMSDACLKLADDSYECHSVKVQDGKGEYLMTRSNKLPWSADGIADDDVTRDQVCQLTWTDTTDSKTSETTYEFTDTGDKCETAGVTYDAKKAVVKTDNQWTFVASY